MSREPVSVLVTPTKSGGSLCALMGSLLRFFDHILPTQMVVVVPDEQDSLVLQQHLADLSACGIDICLIRVDEHQAGDVARWRALAWAHAKHNTAVFVEDNAVIEPGWWQAWRGWALAETASPLASGIVLPDVERLGWVETGVFYCEYGPFIPVAQNGWGWPLRRVAGNHWAVRRDLIAIDQKPASIDEHDWVQRFSAKGRKPDWVTEARVRSYRSIRAGSAFMERGRQGFAYGFGSARKSGWVRRVQMVHGGPAIVLVQLGRLSVVVLTRRYRLKTFLKTLPVTFLLLKTWSLAEWAGWISGTFFAPFYLNKQDRTEQQSHQAEESAGLQSRVIRVDQSHKSPARPSDQARRNAVKYAWIVEKEA